MPVSCGDLILRFSWSHQQPLGQRHLILDENESEGIDTQMPFFLEQLQDLGGLAGLSGWKALEVVVVNGFSTSCSPSHVPVLLRGLTPLMRFSASLVGARINLTWTAFVPCAAA
jgi:hypothetical protein